MRNSELQQHRLVFVNLLQGVGWCIINVLLRSQASTVMRHAFWVIRRLDMTRVGNENLKKLLN